VDGEGNRFVPYAQLLFQKRMKLFVGPIEVLKLQSTVATLVGKPWAMDMVDEGVSRPFKPWDVETSEFPASKRWHLFEIRANTFYRRFREFQEKASQRVS
jgi:hypothetical protein